MELKLKKYKMKIERIIFAAENVEINEYPSYINHLHNFLVNENLRPTKIQTKYDIGLNKAKYEFYVENDGPNIEPSDLVLALGNPLIIAPKQIEIGVIS